MEPPPRQEHQVHDVAASLPPGPAQRWPLFRRRHLYVPTLAGWGLLLVILGVPLLAWWFRGESFLAITDRVPADVLVVEGWIGAEGVRQAAEEFHRYGYHYVVATGGLTGAPWSEQRWSHALVAEEVLVRTGVPRERIVLARPPDDVDVQRTYATARATHEALTARGIRPVGLNVFTRMVHARRSRLVFGKVFAGACPVGAVAWHPPGSEDPAWWRYSYRADDVLKESVGYVLERAFGSGRALTGSDGRN